MKRLLKIFSSLAVGSLLSFVAFAEEPLAPPRCYDVRLGAESIFCLHQGFGRITAQDRAAALEQRILRLAADVSIPLDQVRVEESNGFHQVMGGEDPIMTVSNADGDPDWKLEGGAYARKIVEKIQEVVGSYREQRSSQHLLRGAIYAMGATIVFYLMWLSSRWFFRRLSDRIPVFISKHMQHFRI